MLFKNSFTSAIKTKKMGSSTLLLTLFHQKYLNLKFQYSALLLLTVDEPWPMRSVVMLQIRHEE